MIAIDFETYYDVEVSLRKMPVETYCRHPKFDPYLVSLVGEGIEYVGALEGAPWKSINGKHLVAHNANFDKQVFQWAQKLGKIPLDCQAGQWSCTADASVYHQGPRSLKAAAKEWLGLVVSKEVRENLKGKTLVDLEGDALEAALTYALDDSRTCLALAELLFPTWPEHEQRLSEYFRDAGIRGVGVADNIDDCVENFVTERRRAELSLPWAGKGPSGSLLLLAAHCRSIGIDVPASTAEDDPRCEAWIEKYGEKHPWVRSLQTMRKANRALKLLQAMKSRRRDDGTMPFALKYFGAAATGRWSGDDGFNLQNLPRDPIAGTDIRNFFVPRTGHKFIICDLSQIEPRCLAALSGDTKFLAQIEAGIDPYEAHARTTMGYSDPRPMKDVDPIGRLLAKIRVLQLGYGSGANKFKETAKKFGLEITLHEAQVVVESFRRASPNITGLWERMYDEMKASAKAGEDYEVELPSGRVIKYFHLVANGDLQAATTKGAFLRKWYGGKLVENLVQAVARDVFAHNCLLVIEAGYQVVFTVHDEVVVEVPAEDLEARAHIEALMSTTPVWMPKMPVGAVAVEADKYLK